MTHSILDQVSAPIADSRIENVLQRYEEKLTELEKSASPSEEMVENILIARDAVQKMLEDTTQDSGKIVFSPKLLEASWRIYFLDSFGLNGK